MTFPLVIDSKFGNLTQIYISPENVTQSFMY